MNQPLIAILRCPACNGRLAEARSSLVCEDCSATFTIQGGVPVFLSEPAEMVADHTSNAIGPAFEAILKEGKEFVLHIGAGGTATRFPNCVEFEHKIFRHTDVVGDAHYLPFREGVFDRVFALNVFEHLRDPKLAAAEIFRVLKPGGSLAIHTAFLQAVHEAPDHFYNATEYGVREWFRGFEIEDCRVSSNFGPGVMLAFLLSNVMQALGESGIERGEQARIAETTIGGWAEFWASRTGPPTGFDHLQNLPQRFQARIGAGFELLARKPEHA